MKSQGSSDKNENEKTIPWISFFAKPNVDFRRPQLDLVQNPQNVLLIILLFATTFLLAGGVYNLAENPLPLGYSDQQGYIPIYSGMSNQFLVESLTAGIFFAIGAAGFFLVRYATRYAYDTRSATTIIVLGVGLLVIGILGALIMIQIKITGSI
ncbi:MAG: hypothetical protein ACXAEU_05235 [Candidatus Hodarchaeales archaeon]|jgi:hypothetical protein